MNSNKDYLPLYTLNRLADRVALDIVFFNRFYHPGNIWNGIIELCQRIEEEPRETSTIIVEAKKDKTVLVSGAGVKEFHLKLTRIYILLYYRHRDDKIYKTIVFPELKQSMGVYGDNGILETQINVKIDKIIEQDKMLEQASKDSKESNEAVGNSQQESRIKELEEEKARLIAELANKSLDESDDIQELRALKQEIDELSATSPEKRLAIDERAIFFSTALGLDFDPKRTNQKQLSIFISKLSGDSPESIRGRISKMHKMEVNNQFTDEVLQAARNVKGMLEKIPQGYQSQKIKDIIENIDTVYLNAKNS